VFVEADAQGETSGEEISSAVAITKTTFPAALTTFHLPRFALPRSSSLTSTTAIIPIHQAQDRACPGSSLVKTHHAQDFSFELKKDDN
jgi:hypothetical protein